MLWLYTNQYGEALPNFIYWDEEEDINKVLHPFKNQNDEGIIYNQKYESYSEYNEEYDNRDCCLTVHIYIIEQKEVTSFFQGLE
ncbi:MAG: hypothetical protein LBK92_03825 [Endomicrobium sp.]|nr:hypothetical protein [Endomicrobium sp.]